MSDANNSIDRRQFITMTGKVVAGSMLLTTLGALAGTEKKRIALVGTGIRGVTFMGRDIQQKYKDVIEFVALCDKNPGRVEFAKTFIGADCPTFTNVDEMFKNVGKLDLVMVATDDASHDEIIIKALNRNINVVTEKPMTINEKKCAAIQKAVEKSSAELIMAFNYRYGGIFTGMKEFLETKELGGIVSVDFNWYLNVYHGASYFRRWHGLKDKSGTLLLHKSAHHFDLLNWYIESDPVEVHAYGSLDYYGKNNEYRGNSCRDCPHQKKCPHYWDITKDEMGMNLYVKNEKHDGYIRDNCLWREEIDIFDKMSVQIRYANNVIVNYSLTTYSPFEGFRLAFNGKHGRAETWEGIPWMEKNATDQAKIYEKEMGLASHSAVGVQEIDIAKNFGGNRKISFPYERQNHWGGDIRMMEEIFRNVVPEKNVGQKANFRDGAMAILIGIAARKSIDEQRPVKIAELTTLKPQVRRVKA